MLSRSKELDIDGESICNVISYFKSILPEVGSNARIDTDNMRILYQSDETDNEYDLRLRKEKFNADKERNDRKIQYEKLKLEFDGL
jgi:hypothetical protein